jgi:hypothetical protein
LFNEIFKIFFLAARADQQAAAVMRRRLNRDK